jgi:hypothetical protein
MRSGNHEHFLNTNHTPMIPNADVRKNGISPQPKPQQDEAADLFSCQKSRMDYVTLKRIENRTGIEKENAYAFVLKESLDNAVDFLETQHIGSSVIQKKERKDKEIVPAAAEVKVAILKEDGNKLLRIIVRNSNEYGKSFFSKEMLQSIFDFDTFYSSKRNQYKISRGALGDAFKEILCIPYALSREQQEWNEPLIIRTNFDRIQQTFLVNLIIDRIKQTIRAEITVVESTREQEGRKNAVLLSHQQQQEPNFTEIEVRLPIVEDILDLAKLKKFLVEYATPNTHIGFTFNLPADSVQTNQNQHNTLKFPHVQPISTKWTNTSSIYYYTLSEFQNFIFGLDNNDLPIYDTIQKSFREGSNMKKSDFAEKTIGHIKQSPKNIAQLYTQLHNTMKPISSSSNLALPFDVNKKVRTEAIKNRLEQRRPSFKVSDMKYKSQYGYCKLNGIEYPFFFEIALVHSNGIPHRLDFVESLNSSVMPGVYSFMIGSDAKTFQWRTQSDRKNDSIRTSQSIFEIFEHYGYSHKKDKCKKPNILTMVNLVSPKIDYKSYGKSGIDLAPFANVIAQTTVKACSGGLSTGRSSDIGIEEEQADSVIEFLRRLLKKRYESVKQDPSLKERQRWTQSTVFYRLRPILLDHRFTAESINRQYITSQIQNVCEQYLGVKREELGITAADRAQLYFKGEWHDVGLDEITHWFNMVLIC